MKVNCCNEVQGDTLLGNLIIESIAHDYDKYFGKCKPENTTIELKINGIPANIVEVVEKWEKQLDSLIRKEAEKLLNDKFSDLIGLQMDLNERIKTEIDKRLEDWEKERKLENDKK